MHSSASRWEAWSRRSGTWLRSNQQTIRAVQWCVVLAYVMLIVVPAFLPLPPRTAHLWDNLTLAAQFMFWGIWWPFVLISMVLVGRAWCGLFCPEGALTEFASRHGRGHAVPRWITWGGWPFVAFVCTTVYGQMVSVYQYPKPALLILGGSTVTAMVVGYFYGHGKRVWCRYLCPVNGVFGLLAKLAPVHFRVDAEAWRASQARHEHAERINCAPLVPIRIMRGAGSCHMCGRCEGFRGAVGLAVRSPHHEIVDPAAVQTNHWQTVLILFGLMGVAFGAFDWPTSPRFVAVKQALAERLVDHGIVWPLEASVPWWLLTDYPMKSDVLTVLDGVVLVGYILAVAAIMGAALSACLALATLAAGRWSWPRFHHLAQTLIPLAGSGVFLGLSGLTVSLLRTEGVATGWVAFARAAVLAGAAFWSTGLAWRVAGLATEGLATNGPRRMLVTGCVGMAVALSVAGWADLFWS